MRNSVFVFLIVALALVLIVATTVPRHATAAITYTWDGNGGNDNMSNANNYTADSGTPIAGDSVLFGLFDNGGTAIVDSALTGLNAVRMPSGGGTSVTTLQVDNSLSASVLNIIRSGTDQYELKINGSAGVTFTAIQFTGSGGANQKLTLNGANTVQVNGAPIQLNLGADMDVNGGSLFATGFTGLAGASNVTIDNSFLNISNPVLAILNTFAFKSGRLSMGTSTDNLTIGDGTGAVATYAPTVPFSSAPSIRSLPVGGNLTMLSDAELEIEIGGTGLSDFDRLTVFGNAALNGTLSVSELGYSIGAGDLFEIIDVGGTLSGSFDGLAQGALVGNYSGVNLFIDYAGGDGNDVVLTTTPVSGGGGSGVPEPSTLTLAALGFLAFMRRRRKA